MEFRIADTFTDGLARLTGDEQKAAKIAAIDLQLNPEGKGISFHRIERVRDRNFWSVRASRDIRLIVHRTDSGMLLCYVGHHDDAYQWAERRKLEAHPTTGAAQLVEIRETVQEIVVPVYVQAPLDQAPRARTGSVLAHVAEDDLLAYGVPAEWIADVRAADEDQLLALTEHLPDEASEAVLVLADGGTPATAPVLAPQASPFEHPDAQRRFRIMTNLEELERALEAPWEKWTIFLHPEQRALVERDYNGPARVSGSAGTGKTVVALHRAAYLARQHPDARVLLTTFTDTLANALRWKLRQLVGGEPRVLERIEVHSLDAIGLRLYRSRLGPASIAPRETVRELLRDAASAVGNHSLSQQFLLTEWEQVVDAWQLRSWEQYRDVARLGRRTRLPEAQRAVLCEIFERVRAGLAERALITLADMFGRLTDAIAEDNRAVFDYAVVDEAQDLGVAQLRFLAALGGDRPNALFFAGDTGQRIFQQPFSWKALGVDIRGRSRTLRVNYRTSHEIRTQADRLLGPTVSDVDGNVEERNDTVSVFNGPPPDIRSLASEDDEIESVAAWLAEHSAAGVAAHEFGLFVRSDAQIARATAAVEHAGLPYRVLDEHVEPTPGHVSISTMHLAKGLEFRAVVVMACDDEVIPLQERIETVGDEADLQDVYDTERQLLYVACTRARDHLLVTSVKPGSEFIEDMLG
jgi:hypothetical protein